MPIPRHLNEKWVQFIKEGRCFSCKEKGHTAYNCLKKGKIVAILENVRENSNNQGKK